MTLVYWCPEYEDSQGLRLGTIKAPKGAKVMEEEHRERLGERIQKLVDAEPNPKQAARRLEAALEEAGLMPGTPEDPEDAGATLIWSNPGLTDYLRLKGVVGTGNGQVVEETPDAETAYMETTLEEWIQMIRPDRTFE
ncbi:MAG: hypothetical protein ACQETK_05680 [Pseudomonadota bacterium]